MTVPRVPPLKQIWWTKPYNLGNIALANIISFYINFLNTRNLRIMITSVPVKLVKKATNPDDLVKSEEFCLKPKSRKVSGMKGEKRRKMAIAKCIVFLAKTISVEIFGCSYSYWNKVVLGYYLKKTGGSIFHITNDCSWTLHSFKPNKTFILMTSIWKKHLQRTYHRNYRSEMILKIVVL